MLSSLRLTYFFFHLSRLQEEVNHFGNNFFSEDLQLTGVAGVLSLRFGVTQKCRRGYSYTAELLRPFWLISLSAGISPPYARVWLVQHACFPVAPPLK